jgi:hypothetical protein
MCGLAGCQETSRRRAPFEWKLLSESRGARYTSRGFVALCQSRGFGTRQSDSEKGVTTRRKGASVSLWIAFICVDSRLHSSLYFETTRRGAS